MVLSRTSLSWLLTLLLLISTAGQAAAAFPMPCGGSAPCCCSPATAPHSADSAAPTAMVHGPLLDCCGAASSRSCDIQGQARPASVAVMAPVFVERLDIPAPADATALVRPFTHTAFQGAAQRLDAAGRGRPPRYIEIQTFLC